MQCCSWANVPLSIVGPIPVSKGESDTWAVVLANFDTIFGNELIAFDPVRHLPHGDDWVYYSVRDLVNHSYYRESFGGPFAVSVDESSVRMFKVQKLDFPPVRGNDVDGATENTIAVEM